MEITREESTLRGLPEAVWGSRCRSRITRPYIFPTLFAFFTRARQKMIAPSFLRLFFMNLTSSNIIDDIGDHVLLYTRHISAFHPNGSTFASTVKTSHPKEMKKCVIPVNNKYHDRNPRHMRSITRFRWSLVRMSVTKFKPKNRVWQLTECMKMFTRKLDRSPTPEIMKYQSFSNSFGSTIYTKVNKCQRQFNKSSVNGLHCKINCNYWNIAYREMLAKKN